MSLYRAGQSSLSAPKGALGWGLSALTEAGLITSPWQGLFAGVCCEVRFQETGASPADQTLKGLPRRSGTRSGTAEQPPLLPAALCSLPPPAPRRNSLFWGLLTRRPAPPAGPAVREEGAPLLLIPPTQGPKLKPLDELEVARRRRRFWGLSRKPRQPARCS